MLEIQKILVPTDLSDPSNLALRYGSEMAQKFGARLIVLHVVDDPIIFAETTSDKFRNEAIRDSDEQLRENVSKTIGNNDDIDLQSRCGTAATEIVDFVKDQNVDLVVMGSHGRSAMASMILGNVAEHVVRHSPCPVMTVRWPQHDF